MVLLGECTVCSMYEIRVGVCVCVCVCSNASKHVQAVHSDFINIYSGVAAYSP